MTNRIFLLEVSFNRAECFILCTCKCFAISSPASVLTSQFMPELNLNLPKFAPALCIFVFKFLSPA